MSVTSLLAKKSVDITALLNQGSAVALSYLELQQKNQFEILFTPYEASIMGVLGSVTNTSITKLYVQSVSINLSSFSYERADNIQYLKDVEYPDSVSISFLEDEVGTIRDYINSWAKDIAIIDDEGKYRFADNQNNSKKNAIVIPMTKTAVPSGAWIQLKGLKYMTIGEIALAQDTTENLLIDVEFSCDHVWWKTPI